MEILRVAALSTQTYCPTKTGYYTELGDEPGRTRALSGGEWRRVQLARALAAGPHQPPPQLVLLDDPALLMSDAEARAFMARLRSLVQAEWGRPPPAVVIASQRPLLAAWADQVVILDGGRVLQYGSPQEVVPSSLLGPSSSSSSAGGAPRRQQLQRRQQQPSSYGNQPSASGMAPPRTRGVRWGGGSMTSGSEDDVYLFTREG